MGSGFRGLAVGMVWMVWMVWIICWNSSSVIARLFDLPLLIPLGIWIAGTPRISFCLFAQRSIRLVFRRHLSLGAFAAR